MIKLPAVLFSFRWRWGPFLRRLPLHLLSSFGALWLIAEIASFFSERAKDFLISQWLLFGALGVVSALYSSWPKNSFSYILNNRDVIIEIRVADAFSIPGALVIPTNTTFDTDLNGLILRSPSIQGKFMREYYEGRFEHLDIDIGKQISKAGYAVTEVITGKPGKKYRYEIGTVVQLWKRNRVFYLLALTHISSNGRAVTTEEDLRVALAKLWYYISEHGDKSDIVIPVIGTGQARLFVRKEEVVQDIIRSFIASCSQKNYCSKLTIVIHPHDISKYRIDLDNLDSFLQFACKYVKFDSGKEQLIGTATRETKTR
jgi:hypothetical protein